MIRSNAEYRIRIDAAAQRFPGCAEALRLLTLGRVGNAIIL
jgi:hypothetical protein